MKAIWVNPKEKFEKQVVIGDSTFYVMGWYTKPTTETEHSLEIDVIALVVRGKTTDSLFDLTAALTDLDTHLVSIRNLFAAKILKEYEN